MTLTPRSQLTRPEASLLLAWYDRHHRELPWRVDPKMHAAGIRPDPYFVWLSEVMLQQTTVQAVKAYFLKFISVWPTVVDLAAADREEVLKAWAGLGYYARARNLIKCAEEVVDRFGGKFPDTVEELASLPGIGDYTSAAIAAIAFNRRALVMDGNVERVISRVFAIEMPLPAAKPLMRACLDAITPQDRPGDFAQAMMDLGATVCSPRRPACVFCPWRNDCRAFAQGDPEPFPFKAPKKEKPVRLGAAFVALDDAGRVLLRKRGEKGLLGGMTEVPTTDWTARQDGATDPEAAPFDADWQEKGMVTHVFTHFQLRLTIYFAKVMEASDDHGWWEPVANLEGQALPTVMKKAIAVAIGEKRQK